MRGFNHGPWRKSSRSGKDNECVECASVGSGCAIRDSKNPAGTVLLLDATRFGMFLRTIKSGRLDVPGRP
ncbi:hypothetical protein GCM10012275_17290 [Longimycelium tulufanense]|uniref:DUF397 domain-containing protein n=1 Tax=Longimycelium tulufanense TaxID=907463 RepID=A0A8J3C747_9PSEU|nr:DUF397 domain-containing protein [Longimycelium tulufanense]GGM46760.1 hypothetical protein GCM10012275_17290 [Longimycelium tulufanense]